PRPRSTRTWRRRCPQPKAPTNWRRCSSAAGPTACRWSRPPRNGSRRCSAAGTPAPPSAWSRPRWGRPRWRGWPPARCWQAAARSTSPWLPRPAGQLVVVNGPVREAIGLNSGMGALGPGFRANLTIGRALRLLVCLTGGAMPGAMDRSTLGQMGKLSFCIAEDEETSPWEPLHVERGFAAGQSVVTVIGSDAPLSISDHRSRTPGDLAYILAWAAASAWSTNWWPLAEPSVFVICPEHAQMFRDAGWTKQRLRQFMFEAVRRPARLLRRGETTPVVHSADPDALVPKWASPEAIVLLVAGGEAGRYSAVLG